MVSCACTCMSADRPVTFRRAAELSVLVIVLAVAAAARLWFGDAGIPHAVGIDEPQVVGRALRILQTGDWGPHIFDYPTLVIYAHALVAIVRFLWGALQGEWASLEGYSIAAVYSTGRVVAALVGVATVWLTYRLALELSSRRVALLAAAMLAVRPLHVRESHFILTDVPMAALTTLAVWLAVRAARLGTWRAYAWAGGACGLAAAAKYNGGLALVAVLAAWVVHERSCPDRLRTLGAIIGAAALAFIAGAPYTVLDLPAFLDGFAAQFSRFAAPSSTADAPWLVYLKHLSPPGGRWSAPLAAGGMGLVLWRTDRARWVPPVVFTLGFFYVLATHSHAFGRYALPLVPMLCLFMAVAVFAVLEWVTRYAPLGRPLARRAITVAAVAAVLYGSAAETVRWLDQLKRSDTRALAAEWLRSNAPRAARVAVENNGPTYLEAAGFKVTGTEMLLDQPPAWYRSRVDYLIISAADLARYGDYVNAGSTVYQVSPTPQRWGPPILIVKIAGGN